ncbi:MAG: radical SAM protein [Planctomycetota bacterium]
MARITLVDPYGWQGAVSGFHPCPNVGLAYLVSALRARGHDVSLVDLDNDALTVEQGVAAIRNQRPDIVGISAKTATIKGARKLADKVKRALLGVTIVVGGPHTTFAWRELAEKPYFDVVFVGEGEHVLPTICSRLETRASVDNLPGVVTKQNLIGGFQLNRPLIGDDDLERLPFPSYELFPDNVRKVIRQSYPLVTSRGCPFACTYCSVPTISGRQFRKRSRESVIEELKAAQRKYEVIGFDIIDDAFNVDINRCKEICYALIRENLQMQWSCPNGLRADRIDRELAELMYRSGCRAVMVGVESGDPRVFSGVHKGESLEDIEKGVRILRDAHMRVGAYFIIGLPGDSFARERQSIAFAEKFGLQAHFNMLVPYPGTQVWEWAKIEARFLRNPEDGMHFSDTSKRVRPVIETADFSGRDRRRAYEMVHTRLGRFDMIVPQTLPRWRQDWQRLRFRWQYDGANLLRDLFQRSLSLLGTLPSRVIGLVKKLFL